MQDAAKAIKSMAEAVVTNIAAAAPAPAAVAAAAAAAAAGPQCDVLAVPRRDAFGGHRDEVQRHFNESIERVLDAMGNASNTCIGCARTLNEEGIRIRQMQSRWSNR